MNPIAGNADDTTIYAVIPRPLSRPQGVESLNQDLVVISWCLKWHMRLTLQKIKSMVVSRLRNIAFHYGDLVLGGDWLEKLVSLRILGVPLDSKLTFETHLREVASKVARSLGFVR